MQKEMHREVFRAPNMGNMEIWKYGNMEIWKYQSASTTRHIQTHWPDSHAQDAQKQNTGIDAHTLYSHAHTVTHT